MLCSERELGISEAGDGILILSPEAPVGAEFARELGLLDEVLEVNVTPNRPDALSHAGIAREVAALFETRFRLPAPDEVPVVPVPEGRGVDVIIRDPEACPRYLARIVTGLRGGAEPARAAHPAGRLRRARHLQPRRRHQLVMLETGHPLHAFDQERLKGSIQVRRAGARPSG